MISWIDSELTVVGIFAKGTRDWNLSHVASPPRDGKTHALANRFYCS